MIIFQILGGGGGTGGMDNGDSGLSFSGGRGGEIIYIQTNHLEFRANVWLRAEGVGDFFQMAKQVEKMEEAEINLS
jgi:hypothetical protein